MRLISSIGTNLVVGVHDADEDGGRGQDAPDVVGVHPSVLIDRHLCDGVAQLGEMLARHQGRRMLD
jgi:hypothetical protein